MELLNKCFCDDYFHFETQLEDDSIDMIIQDPPYNIGDQNKITLTKKKRNLTNYHDLTKILAKTVNASIQEEKVIPTNKKQKASRILSNAQAWGKEYNDKRTPPQYLRFLKQFAESFYRVLKQGGSLFIYYDFYHQDYLRSFYKLFGVPQNIFVLIKDNPQPHMRKTNYRVGYEQCAWFSKGIPKTFNFQEQKNMINIFHGSIGCLGIRETDHPNEKYEWEVSPLILNHSKENDIILDVCGGSGTTSKLAKRYNRQFIYVDNDPRWVKQAEIRISRTKPDTTYRNLTLAEIVKKNELIH